MVEVRLFVDNRQLNTFDTTDWIPHLSSRIAGCIRRLERTLNFREGESTFLECSVESALDRLVSCGTEEDEELRWKLRIFDWGPITDDARCFLIPIWGTLYLACRRLEDGQMIATPILPIELIDELREAQSRLALACAQAERSQAGQAES
ncbi:MAG: hypothetical protein JNM58_07695 [Xanthomonadaceae bacterium]|nr:hypothetical protein [Xanthomonadaceae bacterium]